MQNKVSGNILKESRNIIFVSELYFIEFLHLMCLGILTVLIFWTNSNTFLSN